MKKVKTTLLALVAVLSLGTIQAQEEESDFSVGADVVSSYIWRGTNCGLAPAIQPCISYATGSFEIGAWGSTSFNYEQGGYEADLYLGYSFDFGLSVTLTDYYFGGDWTEFGDNHSIEPMLTYETESGLSFSAAYMFLAAAEDGSTDFAEEGDMYFEIGYAFDNNVSLFLGAGDGQYTMDDDGDDDFMICNIGMSYSTELSLGNAKLPVFGSIVINPANGGFYPVVGFSF